MARRTWDFWAWQGDGAMQDIRAPRVHGLDAQVGARGHPNGWVQAVPRPIRRGRIPLRRPGYRTVRSRNRGSLVSNQAFPFETECFIGRGSFGPEQLGRVDDVLCSSWRRFRSARLGASPRTSWKVQEDVKWNGESVGGYKDYLGEVVGEESEQTERAADVEGRPGVGQCPGLTRKSGNGGGNEVQQRVTDQEPSRLHRCVSGVFDWCALHQCHHRRIAPRSSAHIQLVSTALCKFDLDRGKSGGRMYQTRSKRSAPITVLRFLALRRSDRLYE